MDAAGRCSWSPREPTRGGNRSCSRSRMQFRRYLANSAGPGPESLDGLVKAIAGLTAVDGAVVLTDRYELLGFGAKISRRQRWPRSRAGGADRAGRGLRTGCGASGTTRRHPPSFGGAVHPGSTGRGGARGFAGRPLYRLRVVLVREYGSRAPGGRFAAVSARRGIVKKVPGRLLILAAFCYGIAFSATPALVDLYRAGEGGYSAYRIPAMVTTSKGTLLAFCEGRKNSASDSGDIDIVLRRSFDNGRTWSPAQVVADKDGDTIGNPAPVVDRKSGTILLLLTSNPAPPRSDRLPTDPRRPGARSGSRGAPTMAPPGPRRSRSPRK